MKSKLQFNLANIEVVAFCRVISMSTIRLSLYKSIRHLFHRIGDFVTNINYFYFHYLLDIFTLSYLISVNLFSTHAKLTECSWFYIHKINIPLCLDPIYLNKKNKCIIFSINGFNRCYCFCNFLVRCLIRMV